MYSSVLRWRPEGTLNPMFIDELASSWSTNATAAVPPALRATSPTSGEVKKTDASQLVFHQGATDPKGANVSF